MPDSWTALQFDNAVMHWGIHVENKLKETNQDGSPKNSLRDLLDIPLTRQELREATRRSLKLLDKASRDRRSGIVAD
jgi:hypothetical protein